MAGSHNDFVCARKKPGLYERGCHTDRCLISREAVRTRMPLRFFEIWRSSRNHLRTRYWLTEHLLDCMFGVP